MDKSQKSRIIRLTSRLLDECITDDEKNELELLLESSEEARIVYSGIIQNESLLIEAQGRPKVPHSHNLIQGSFLKVKMIPVAAALLLGFSISWAWMNMISPSTNQAKQDVAFLRTPEQPEPKRVKTGKYKLNQGDYYLDFFSGAKVRISAPARFEIRSAMHIHLKKGRIVANINESSKLFKITGDNNSFVDLGTEFALNIDENTKSELFVYEGEVIANTMNEFGDTERVKTVKSNQALQYDYQEKRFRELEDSERDFLNEHDFRSAPLRDLHQFKKLVLEASPRYYWSFDKQEENSFRSHHSESLYAIMGSNIDHVFNGSNGAVYFSEADDYHELKLNHALEFKRNEAFSIEFLFCPDRINRATLVSLYEGDRVKHNGSTNHFVLIETMASPDLFSHVPVTLRTVYRPVAGTSSETGINAFTQEQYSPGKWVHMAVTFDGKTLRTYKDSNLQNQVQIAEDELSEDGVYSLVIGQIAGLPTESESINLSHYRRFIGLIDEFAIYGYALSADTVKMHYKSL